MRRHVVFPAQRCERLSVHPGGVGRAVLRPARMMSEWRPVVVGLGGIVGLVIAAGLLPRSWLRADLERHYGAKPSGAYGVMMRRDLARRALYSALAAAALIGLSLGLYPLSQHFRADSHPQLIFEAYFFCAFLLGLLAAAAAVGALVSIAIWRPRRLTLTVDRKRDLAEYFDLMRRGAVPDDIGPDFAAVRFDDPEVERIRLEYVARAGSPPRKLGVEYSDWLRGAVASLLGQTA